ncbi:hypothetical protein JKP88DRAFT_267877 [Tribonema minus]|uniref:Uncharacterized protein n=1 Tax=Tribonema minus TaxID=303371 RepID=A0A835Z8C7_9STRA|nr:hypothetical protein JKP88DRAFT_267877 [Tribonema minus]
MQSKAARWMARVGTWLLWQFAAVIVLHTIFLRSPFVGTFPGVLPRLTYMFSHSLQDNDVPFYDSKVPFSAHYGRTPLGRYGHMLLAVPWSIIAALQLNAGFRARRPRAHRRLGYAFVLLDVVMMAGVFDIMYKNAGFSHVEAHKTAIYARTAFTALAFLATGAVAVGCARRRAFAAHRRAALHHVAIGHAVSTQRLALQARSVYFNARSAARAALCAGAALDPPFASPGAVFDAAAAAAERGGTAGGLLARFCGAAHEGALTQEERQLMFSYVVFLSVFFNCALVELCANFKLSRRELRSRRTQT